MSNPLKIDPSNFPKGFSAIPVNKIAKPKVLIGSPIHQKPEILKEFLESLKELDKTSADVSYMFVDDNNSSETKNLLNAFSQSEKNVILLESQNAIQYICDDYTHRWSEDLVNKVTAFKNRIIEYSIEQKFDYLFFIDSDIVLHPKTLNQLLSDDKEIVSNIFWTKWNPQTEELPQVWLKDAYSLYDAKGGTNNVTQAEVQQATFEFLQMLKKPGVYPVGGLGACTLIKTSALEKGINFDPVYNISFWGEDRHFCIRAAVHGVQLNVDTFYPAYHIYREEDLAGVSDYKAKAHKRDTEILGAQLLDIIIKGIQDSSKYSYYEEPNTDWAELFTFKEANRIKLEQNKNRKKVISDKLINNLQVMECQLTFYNNNTMVIAKIKYNEQGYKNSYSFYNEYEGEVTLTSNSGQNWRIDSFEKGKKRILDFIPLIRKAKDSNNKLTLSMVVKNEGDRFLRRALLSARDYIDNAVIIDDGSTDNTVAIIKEVLKDIPYVLIENKNSKFNNEVELRKQQWFETIAINPDWILFLDADEIFEDKFKLHVKEMMNNINSDGYIFRLYDFWDEDNYRDDKLWCAHYTYRLFMIRYQKNFRYVFRESAQHCGRMPENCMELPYAKCDLRLKHLGWSRLEDRLAKYERYMQLDPDGKFGSLDQYKSILDPSPKLARWTENE